MKQAAKMPHVVRSLNLYSNHRRAFLLFKVEARPDKTATNMNHVYRNLQENLTAGLRAWRRSRLQRGVSITLLGLFGLAALALLTRPIWEAAPALWWILAIIGLAAWATLVLQNLILPLRRQPTLNQIARYLEERNPNLEDRLATAIEFGEGDHEGKGNLLWHRLVQEATEQAAHLHVPEQLQIRFAQWWRLLAVAATTLAVLLLFRAADLYQGYFASYFKSNAQASQAVEALQVKPGNARVPRGETVEVIAESPHLEASEATLYLEQGPQSWLPYAMSSTTQLGKFTHQLFDVLDTLRYYVRVSDEISPIFTIIALDAPEIKALRVTYIYPQEIGRRPQTEENGGDIYAPDGTEIQIEATSTQPLAKAEWRLDTADFRGMDLRNDTLAVASFTVTKDGYYLLRFTNNDGMTNKPVEYFIHLLPDEPPQITITRPGRDLRPTMLEEVPVEARVREDYGLKQLTLIYSHNNQPAVRQDLLAQAARVQRPGGPNAEFIAGTLLYLEDLGARPGDFISYYFEAQDAKQTATSDLYFFEIRPFEEEFYRALSQGGGGGMPSAGLSISQKEIITATWKLEQKRSTTSEGELARSSAALAETQASLQESISRMAENARMRGQFTGESDEGKMVTYLEQAAEAMQRAVPLLQAIKLAEALVPEREAYHFLLQADAELRRREVMQGSGAGSSFTQLQSREELAQLFKEELDKIQSKYETLQNRQQQESASGLSEAQQKVRELAQRQERLVDLNRQLSRENALPQERKRQIDRLRREQEQINRDLQNLNRQMRQLSSASASGEQTSQQLRENLEKAAEDLQRSLDNLRRDNPATAAADGNRAVERLRRLQDQLQRQQTGSLREEMKQLREDFQQLAEQQGDLRTALEQQGEQVAPEQRQTFQEQQRALQRQSEQALQDLRRLQEFATAKSEKPAVARDLRNLTNDLEQRRIPERMEQAAQALAQNEVHRALAEQQDARQALLRAEKALQQSLSQLSSNPDEQLDLALQEAQRVRRELERGLAESRENNAQAGGSPLGQGRASQQNQNTPSQQAGHPGDNSNAPEQLRPEDMNWWTQQLWSGVRQLENVGQFMRNDSALADDYARLMQNYRGVLRNFQGGNPQRLSEIERTLIDPLRRFEAELAARLANLQLRERLLTIRDERVPPQYRKMVEEYFERLAKSKQPATNNP